MKGSTRTDALPGDASARRGRVLVWGAAGFIGQHLTQHLLDLDESVTVLCRKRRARTEPRWADRVEWITFGENDEFESVLDRALADATVVYNLAGSSGAVASNRSPLESLDANCRVQLQFVSACARSGQKPHVVFPSSRLVYGPTGDVAVREDRPPNPQSIYAAHKLCVEQYLQVAASRSELTYTICRITNPYGFDPTGTDGAYKILNLFVAKALAGEAITLFGDGGQLRDFIHVSDLVRRLAVCGREVSARNQTLNIGSGISRTLRNAAEAIRDLSGAEIRFQPWPADYLAVETGNFVCDISKSSQLLPLDPPVNLEDGLKEAIESYRRVM